MILEANNYQGTLTSCIGSLSTPEGQRFQERAYEDIMRYYPTIKDAWNNSFQEEKVPYVNAIIKEAARYYTVSAMSLPRKTVTDVMWDGARIPAKTMILINAQAANHGRLPSRNLLGVLTWYSARR
jgi:phenylacetate 2-hydroxylase